MAVYIYESTAFRKIVAVEGEDWRKQQDPKIYANADSPCGWRFALRTWLKYVEEYQLTYAGSKDPEDLANLDRWMSREGSTQIVIYGDGGWNRYFVRGNGEIVFSRGHSNPRSVAKAEAAGFAIWG